MCDSVSVVEDTSWCHCEHEGSKTSSRIVCVCVQSWYPNIMWQQQQKFIEINECDWLS